MDQRVETDHGDPLDRLHCLVRLVYGVPRALQVLQGMDTLDTSVLWVLRVWHPL